MGVNHKMKNKVFYLFLAACFSNYSDAFGEDYPGQEAHDLARLEEQVRHHCREFSERSLESYVGRSRHFPSLKVDYSEVFNFYDFSKNEGMSGLANYLSQSLLLARTDFNYVCVFEVHLADFPGENKYYGEILLSLTKDREYARDLARGATGEVMGHQGTEVHKISMVRWVTYKDSSYHLIPVDLKMRLLHSKE